MKKSTKIVVFSVLTVVTGGAIYFLLNKQSNKILPDVQPNPDAPGPLPMPSGSAAQSSSSPAKPPYPLYRSSKDNKVFVIINNRRHWITSREVLEAIGYTYGEWIVSSTIPWQDGKSISSVAIFQSLTSAVSGLRGINQLLL